MEWRGYDSRGTAAAAAADFLAAALGKRLERPGTATMAVSGGSSPRDCYRRLSAAALDWSRVRVTVTDERCVPPDHPESNARMVRECLLQGAAARATAVEMDDAGADEFAAVLLGMGEDGHFASLFPDLGNLAEGLSLDSAVDVIAARTAASPVARRSLTLARLTRTAALGLLAFGAGKRAIIDTPAGYPVEQLFRQGKVPVHVFWAE